MTSKVIDHVFFKMIKCSTNWLIVVCKHTFPDRALAGIFWNFFHFLGNFELKSSILNPFSVLPQNFAIISSILLLSFAGFLEANHWISLIERPKILKKRYKHCLGIMSSLFSKPAPIEITRRLGGKQRIAFAWKRVQVRATLKKLSRVFKWLKIAWMQWLSSAFRMLFGESTAGGTSISIYKFLAFWICNFYVEIKQLDSSIIGKRFVECLPKILSGVSQSNLRITFRQSYFMISFEFWFVIMFWDVQRSKWDNRMTNLHG